MASNPLLKYITPEGDLSINGDNWSDLNESYTQQELTHAMVQLKMDGILRMPAPYTTEGEASADFQALRSVTRDDVVVAGSFDTKYDVPLVNPLGVFTGNRTGIQSSDYFHFPVRSRVGDYHCNKGVAVRWERMNHDDCNFMSCLWSQGCKSISRTTMLSRLRMRLTLAPQFRPAVAKALYDIYEGGDVLDLCGGWGDRLAGAMASECVRSFTVIEPRPEAASLYQQQWLLYGTPKPLTIYTECAEVQLPQLPEESFDLIFTSPPYFDCEHYGDATTDPDSQSHRRYRKFLQWCEGFLFPVVDESCRVLKRGGFLILNVNDVMRRQVRHHVCDNLLGQMAKHSEMRYIGVWGYALAQRMGRNLQNQRSSTRLPRAEPMYVWQKL